MKKYILFFISIGLLLTTMLVISTVNVEKNKKVIFNESGYILNGSTDRYYFRQNETYTPSYNDKIVFYDTEGEKVTIDNNNFVHYTSGNVLALQDSVLLDLSKLNSNPIIYYNVSATKEVKKISDRYTLKNLEDDIQFVQAIWKISGDKYIFLGDKIKVVLNNGMTKELDGYVEINYFDNEIVNIYNQEFSCQTISSNSYLELENGIKINLGTKIVSQNGENKMALEDMVINSDDNVTLIDLTIQPDNIDEQEGIEGDEDQANGGQAGVVDTTQNVVTNNATNIVGGTEDGVNEEDLDSGEIEIETPEIIYEFVSDNENKVDESLALAEPTFKLEDVELTATGIQANIQITDEDDLLSKDEVVEIKIVNNETAKLVYASEEDYGMFSIPLDIQTLSPNTSYTIIASATYTLDEQDYTKNFLNKTFATTPMGVEMQKEVFTDKTLVYTLMFTDNLVEKVQATLLDAQGNEIPNRKQIINNDSPLKKLTFDGLTPDTQYTIRISKITYNGIIQEGEGWKIEDQCSTLKEKATINQLNYSSNKRDSTFTLYIEDVTDTNNSIINYTYVVYQCVEEKDENGQNKFTYDTENILYQRQTTSKEITLSVGDENSGEKIVRGKYYGFKVIASTYDNEKYVDIESSICGAFILNGKEFPTVKFERVESDYPPTEIRGWLYIIDNANTIIVDEENPLTITYYSDVEEGAVYSKRVSLDSEEITTDSSGNDVIKMWVDLGEKGSSKKGLKAETSYTFSVYGTVVLNEEYEEYKNVHIGSAIVTTKSYETLEVNLSPASSYTSSAAFTVELSLDGDEVAKEGLSSINLMLYEGSGDINSGEYNNWTRTITNSNYSLCLDNAKNNTEVSSLQDLLFNNSLLITPAFIAGGKEGSFTEANYQVIVTATVDGTEFLNKIPIQCAQDDNEFTGDTTYTDKDTKQTYTAAYIIVEGKGTMSDVTSEARKIGAIGIENEDATRFNLTQKEDLADSTYVGYYVSTDFTNTGSMTAKEITYYAWDKNGNPVLDGTGKQLTKTLKFTNQDKAPSAVFELDYGTTKDLEEDNLTGLHRGGAYYFTYTVTYLEAGGGTILWPLAEDDETQEDIIRKFKTDIVQPKKEEATFVFYPKTSDINTLTYVYSCKDPDKALYYEDKDNTTYTNLTLSLNGTEQNSNIQALTDGTMHDLTLQDLYTNITYKLSYSENLNKTASATYIKKDLVTQEFAGILNCDGVIIKNIICNDDNNPNNIKIELAGEGLSRIAAAQVTLQSGEEQIVTDLLKLNTDSGFYINVSLLDLSKYENFAEFIGKDINVSVVIYYDNGRVGYELTNPKKYTTYADSEGQYLKFENNNFVYAGTVNGNIYESRFSKTSKAVQLALKDMNALNKASSSTDVDLSYSPQGLIQNDIIVVQKEIEQKQIDDVKTIKIEGLTLGIQVGDISSTISTATIKAKIINPLNIEVDELVLELCYTDTPDGIPNWDECEIRTVSIDNISQFTLENLVPSVYYHLRFKYEKNDVFTYTYDIDTKQTGKIYNFETLATIGIINLELSYEAQNYREKYIDIYYEINPNRSNMFEKVKYEFYKEDGTTKVNLTQKNIVENTENATYQIIDGSLIVTNPKYQTEELFNSVFEQISISPEYNKFTMGGKYIIKIIPLVTINEADEYEIETVSQEFTVKKLDNPSVGLKMERRTTTTATELIKYIRIQTTIKDTDKVIYGTQYGEFELHVYKYKTSLEDKIEVDIYNTYQGGQKITGNTFNLREHASKYPVYVQERDIDYSYNYIVQITYKSDKKNKETDFEDKVVQYELKAISNDAEVSIGSVTLVKNDNLCEVRFYDSYYNIEKINKVEYTIIELTSNFNQAGTFKPEWTLVNDGSGVPYYKMDLPPEFSTQGTYTIKMNLYVGNTLVEQVDTTFIY